MSKKKQDEVKFSLAAIELLKASINHPETAIPSHMNFQYDISIEHRFRVEENLFLVITKVDVRNDDKTILLGSLTASCIYKINELHSFVEKETNKIQFPITVLDALNSISISTTRGMIFSYFRGTFLHNAHLPLVDPKQLRPNLKKP